ncbi:hypothetical protein JTB14_007112 [Gonioctena quinquepunctata]|nr:hypothetical protein JTB14_007112 [Gonioctena quinquepunctata]
MKSTLIISLGTVKTAEKRALQKSHEKPQAEKWADAFLRRRETNSQEHMVELLKIITKRYLSHCTPIILFDVFTEKNDNMLLEKLFRDFPTPLLHGRISEDYQISLKKFQENIVSTCVSYILFMKDVMKSRQVIGEQSEDRVVVVARSSQWRVFEFLSHEVSRSFVNLLVIVESQSTVASNEEPPYILFTHKLYIDALGSSGPDVLTCFQRGEFTRNVTLFPKKLANGFSGHRFIISMSHQPPFVILKGRNSDGENIFEGIEIRLINMLSKMFNFTTDYQEATEDTLVGSAEAVTRTVQKKKANIGIGGIYVTEDKLNRVGMTQWHTPDCAAFISTSSTALPRYRAIMGPFQWTVWLTLIIAYLSAILLLTYSDKHTLKHLLKNPEEMENMFWYVFGTFTNCFTFTGKASWSKADKLTTKLLIAFYWFFTIIITAGYTGSIIAFVTLPVKPTVVDTVDEFLNGRYRIGVLDKGEWANFFSNSSDVATEKLLKNMELVPNVASGLKNVTKSFFWNYAFLGSREELDYIIKANKTYRSKRSVLHISTQCFALFNVALVFPKKSVYGGALSQGVKIIFQAGLLSKIKSDVEWEMFRSPTGKLLAANSKTTGLKILSYDDRALTLDDTQGMFLLLSAGFLVGAAALASEWFGGCFKLFKRKTRPSTNSTIASNPRVQTG